MWTRGLWVSLLAACSCPVLHMASDSVLLAMCLCFVWVHGFCHSFCVPCALMSIVLIPPILFPDYWLIFPTCVSSLPSSFAPFIISLCLLCCVNLSYVVYASSLRQPCQSVSLYGVVFVCWFYFIINKALFPPASESSLSSLPPTLLLKKKIWLLWILKTVVLHHTFVENLMPFSLG